MIFQKVSRLYYNTQITELKKEVSLFRSVLIGTFVVFVFVAALGMEDMIQERLRTFLIVDGIIAILSYLLFRKSRRQLSVYQTLVNEPPVIKILPDGSMTLFRFNNTKEMKLNHITDYQIIGEENIIRVIGDTSEAITIDFELEQKALFLMILEIFENMTSVKDTMRFNTFRKTLVTYKDTKSILLKEIETMDFVIAVQCHFDKTLLTMNYLDLANEVKLAFEVRNIDNKLYIALYSDLKFIPKNNKYPQSYRVSYHELFEWINNQVQEMDIYKSRQFIDGVAINPDYECVLIDIR